MFSLTRIRRTVKRSPTLRNIYFRVAGLRHRARLRGARLRGGLEGSEQATGVNPENVVWIFCTARSGSTWMRSMLDDLVDGEVWEEPKVGRLFGEFYSRAKPTQLGRTNYVLGEPTREAWTGALRDFVLRTAWASHPSVTPERYLIVKEPGGAVGAPLLMAALPESRMVLLVRDPRDFAASVLDATRKGGWMQEGMDEWARRDLDSEKDVQRYLRALSRQYVRQMGNGKKAFDDARRAQDHGQVRRPEDAYAGHDAGSLRGARATRHRTKARTGRGQALLREHPPAGEGRGQVLP